MGTTLEIQQDLNIARGLPGATSDTSTATMSPIRAGRYKEQYGLSLVPTTHLLADEGTYFVATNPTPGTALANAVSASFSDTVPFAYLQNRDSVTNVNYKRIYLHYVKVIVTVAAASGTGVQMAMKLDTTARSIGTNNMTSLTPVSPNSDVTPSSIALVDFQNSASASALGASSAAARVVARASTGGLTIIGDEIVWMFGDNVGPSNGLTAVQATDPGRKVSGCPPVIIGPGDCLTLYLWFPNNSTTGLSYELECGWWER